jgi:hypothetical protein
MCGPSSSEKSIANSSQSFASQLQNNYGTLFGQQQGVLNSLNASLNPILSAGPSQRGFSSAQTSALQTSAINNAGAANTAAQQAARTYGAGQGGGGTSGITSGITKQIQAGIASQSAGQEASQLNQITQADFAQGNANYWRAQGGLQQLGEQYSPNSAESGTINEQGQAFQQQSQITQENNAMAKDIAGFATSLAGAGASFLTGGLSNLGAGESASEGIGDFFKGGLSGLSGR